MYIHPPKIEDYNMTKDKPELSIVMPATHPEKWTDIYNSIIASTRRSFELIIVTNRAENFPPWLWNVPNIKVVKDYGSPVRAHNIGASLAEGKFITWIPDDGFFTPHGLEVAIDKLCDMKENKKNILAYKFSENEKSYTDEYYKINYHQSAANGIGSAHIPDNYYILNHVIMYREYYEDLGGFNGLYEGTAMAYIDFSIRAQHDGAIVQLLKGIPILLCTQLQPHEDSHSFIHDAQTTHDEPLYKSIYHESDWREKAEIILDHTSEWKKSPTIWPRKYGHMLKPEDFAYSSMGNLHIKVFMESRERDLLRALQEQADQLAVSKEAAISRQAGMERHLTDMSFEAIMANSEFNENE